MVLSLAKVPLPSKTLAFLSCQMHQVSTRVNNSQMVYSILLMLLLAGAGPTSTTSSSIAKPGCRDRCGNISIPYPFGIDSPNCYFDKAFQITCNDSHAPPVPFIIQNSSDYINDDPSSSLVYHQYQVLELTLDYVRILASAPAYCYNQTTEIDLWTSAPVYYLSDEGPFTFSGTHNNFSGVSCDSQVYMYSEDQDNYNTTCASPCALKSNSVSCYGGNGCNCQTTIPKGLKFYKVRVTNIKNNKSEIPNKCSHAVVVERDFLPQFHELSLTSKDSDLWSVHVILDWAIGRNTTCSKAQKYNNLASSSYACGKNTDCVDSDNSPGYLCKCSKGYQGNPYILDGCQKAPTPTPTPSYQIAKEGCRDRCGNVSIPYPFGIGSSHCYLDYPFEIICDDSKNPPLPLLQYSEYLLKLRYSEYFNYWYEVLQITLDYVRINVSAPSDCYNETTGQGRSMDMSYFLLDGHFTFSNTRNKLTAIGCDIFAYITHDNNQNGTTTGCASNCVNGALGYLPSCINGKGCCQTAIPEGLNSFLLQIDSINNNNGSGNHPYGCNKVFLIDQEFPGLKELNLSREDLYVPVIMDWAVGNTPCKDAQRNSTSYACGGNTSCVESNNGPGYRCKCLQGYTGNPYLRHGCQDINECESDVCGKEVKGVFCINTEGSYKCVLGKHKLHNNTLVVVVSLGIAIATVLILLLALSFWLYHRLDKRKRTIMKQNHFKRNGGLLLKQKISSNDGRVEQAAAKIFLTEELERVTDNFNQSRIIGHGGFGTVYKGMLSDGRIVAIKKSKLVDESQVDQFINEVVILSQINHRHIVKLLGCCLETQVPLLVYEFVSNGTLSYHLHGEGGDRIESSISWKDRLRIATEAAGALAYLHSDASIPILHRDIKSSNILLDENYKAKVSDFGLSRSLPLDKTHLTTLVQGTFGYLDPEYFHSCQYTEKSDVYSFGVVLVELLTGQRAISLIRSENEKSLVIHFISSLKENRLFDILEDQVVNEGDKDDILVVANLAKRCLKLNGRKRPTMKEIAASLDGLMRNFQNQPWDVDCNKFQEEEEEEAEECLIGDELSYYKSNYESSSTFEVEDRSQIKK